MLFDLFIDLVRFRNLFLRDFFRRIPRRDFFKICICFLVFVIAFAFNTYCLIFMAFNTFHAILICMFPPRRNQGKRINFTSSVSNKKLYYYLYIIRIIMMCIIIQLNSHISGVVYSFCKTEEYGLNIV